MIRDLYGNVHMIVEVFAIALFLCILIYFIVGVIAKKQGVSLKMLLIGEEHLFIAISSVGIFLVFSLQVALVIWVLMCFLMCFIFKINRKIIAGIEYYEQNKNLLTRSQTKLLSQLNPRVAPRRVNLLFKDFLCLRREVWVKLDRAIHTYNLDIRCKILSPSYGASVVIGVFATLLAYGTLVENHNRFFVLLVENYVLLFCVLYIIYWIMRFSIAVSRSNFFRNKRLFRLMFSTIVIIMFIFVTVISMNT